MKLNQTMKEKIKITKKDHLWTSDKKLKFCGYGEWVEEADITEIEYLGYEACIVRIFKIETFTKEEVYFGGHLCGYVKIPESHPYYGDKDVNLEVHGGLTFNSMEEEHWVGFDCAHSGDMVPTIEHFKKTRTEMRDFEKKFPIPESMKDHPWFKPVYKNIDYCIQECVNMIDQLIKVSVIDKIKDKN